MSTSGRSYAGRPVEVRRAERKQRLLVAALEMFAAEGYRAARIEALCALAGVSTRNFYEEFNGKEAVLVALHGQINGAGLRAATEALDRVSPDDLRGRVTAAVTAFMAGITADARLARIAYVDAVAATPAMEAQHRRWVAHWAQLIEDEADRAAASGLLSTRSYHLTSIAIIGAATELLRDWQAHTPPPPADDITAELIRITLAALMAP